MFRSTTDSGLTAQTDAPVKGRSNNMYQTTFSGPIQKDRTFQDAARNESMAKAAYQGEPRQFMGNQGKGIRAGGKMEAERRWRERHSRCATLGGHGKR